MTTFRPATFRTRPGLAVCALFTALLTGCATSHEFAVDAVRRADPAMTERLAYRLVTSPSLDAAPSNALANARVLRDVRTALSSKGLFEAPVGVKPELDVEVDFGIEAPVEKTRTHTEPVYVFAPSLPRIPGQGGLGAIGSAAMPRRIGERTVTTTVTVRPKFLRLTARAPRTSPASLASPPLWSVVVTNQDASDDLVRYVRLMVAAAMDHIDLQSPAGAVVVLDYEDGRVRFIEQGMTETDAPSDPGRTTNPRAVQ